MTRPVLLDLFCGAGIAARGWGAAGFDVIGVDLNPQPSYPYPFVLFDAIQALRGLSGLEARPPFLRNQPDVIVASPPCQLHTRAKHLRDAQGGKSKYDDLLTPTLALLDDWERQTGGTWVVENVENAKALMPGAVKVCGSHFGLAVRRHRLFMSNADLVGTTCRHKAQGRPWGVYHVPGDNIPDGGRTARDVEHGKFCMGVQPDVAVTWAELKEGYPPQYAEWIGRQVMAQL